MNRKLFDFPGGMYKGIAETFQSSMMQIERQLRSVGEARTSIAKVIKCHSDRNTCDIQTIVGSTYNNVPIGTSAGLNNKNEVYGEIDLPQPNTYVIVEFIEDMESRPFIASQIIPYLVPEFGSSQVAANSSNKQFTLKLLEENKTNTYKKIFPSGTTIEVGEDGSVTVETPTGFYMKRDETAGTTKIYDDSGNKIDMVKSPAKIQLNGTNFEVLV